MSCNRHLKFFGIAVLGAALLAGNASTAVGSKSGVRSATKQERAGLKSAFEKRDELVDDNDYKYVVSIRNRKYGAVCAHSPGAGNETTVFRRKTRSSNTWRYVTGGSGFPGGPILQSLLGYCQTWRL